MSYVFQSVTIFGRPRPSDHGFSDTLNSLYQFLKSHQIDVFIEEETAKHHDDNSLPTLALDQLDQGCDLLIVIGGDGSLLNAARTAIHYDLPLVGINRGRLGFLTDIIPAELEEKLRDVLKGKFIEEKRFLLHADYEHEGKTTAIGDALNDVVLLPGDVPQMIEFEIFINQKMVNSQRADGLIIATPTGSTAYALSGGGPILHPELDAIALVPMFPHTLSSRPIVIDSHQSIEIKIDEINDSLPRISCDGQKRQEVVPGSSIHIRRKSQSLRLLHPLDYNYYETLRSKLKWEIKH